MILCMKPNLMSEYQFRVSTSNSRKKSALNDVFKKAIEKDVFKDVIKKDLLK